MRSMHGWRLASIITSVFLVVGLLGAPGAALVQDDGYDHDHGASAEVSPAGLAAFDEVLLGARTLGTIVGRMDAPVHSGTLAAEEGSGADVWFHVLEGDAWDLKEMARALVAAATDPDEAQRILVDELFPGVQAFASQAFAMREELGRRGPGAGCGPLHHQRARCARPGGGRAAGLDLRRGSRGPGAAAAGPARYRRAAESEVVAVGQRPRRPVVRRPRRGADARG